MILHWFQGFRGFHDQAQDLDAAGWRRLFVGWLSFSLATHLVCSYFSVGYHSIDEHFQIFEFLNFKLGKTPTADLPMEYFEQLRSWVQPGLYYGIVQTLKLTGIQSPFIWAWAFRLFSSLVGWLSLVGIGLCSRVWFTHPRAQKICLAAIGLLWFLPPLHARTSSEGLGGSFFMLGLSLITLITQPTDKIPPSWAPWLQSRWLSWGAGIFFGLSFECRFQMALMICGTFLWSLIFIKTPAKQKLSLALNCFAGFLLVFVLGRWVDAWGYGVWTLSPWHYLKYNILDGKVAGFGETPWWEIFRVSLTEVWPPFGLVILFAILIAWVRNPLHLLTWAQLPFFLVHEMIGHKELRFFFPLLNASPALLSMCLDSDPGFFLKFSKFFKPFTPWITQVQQTKWTKRAINPVIKITWVICGVLLLNYSIAFVASIISPATRTVWFYEAIDRHLSTHPEIKTLYTLDRDPFNVFGTPTHFYRPREFEVLNLTSARELVDKIKKSNADFYLIHSHINLPQEAPELQKSCHPVEQMLPRWIQHLNFSNIGAPGTWLDRISVWGLFKCQGSQKFNKP
jgi:phosphatidylinositol glycan class B